MTQRLFTTRVEEDLLARVRACVRGVARATGRDFPLQQLVNEALASECAALEEAYNDGAPWPPEVEPLKGGRPL